MGAGAWRVPPYYSGSMIAPDDEYQRQRVRWAVVAIQRDLIRQGHLEYKKPLDTLGGGFGPATVGAVRRFQVHHNLVVDGLFGRRSSEVLFRDWFVWWQAVYGIPDDLVFAMCRHESSLDPGAEGYVDSRDRGIAQYNRLYHPDITDQIAFSRPDLCIQRAAIDLAGAYQRLGVESWDPAIAHHNNPAKAYEWARTGRPPDSQISGYVAKVRAA